MHAPRGHSIAGHRVGRSYGVLTQISTETLEFTVSGRVQRTWTLSPPLTSMSDLLHRCLVILAHEGWRPISHQPNPGQAVVLARVPYPAGSKLAVHGTLRFMDQGDLVLTVSGAAMQRWKVRESREATLSATLTELELQGWRLQRRYHSGATVVRG